jgi:hypothetical protein
MRRTHSNVCDHSMPDENADSFESHIETSSPFGVRTTNLYFSGNVAQNKTKHPPSTDFFVELHLALKRPFRLEFTDPVHLHATSFPVSCPLLPRPLESSERSGTQNCNPPSSSTLSSRSLSRTAHSMGSTGRIVTGLTLSWSWEVESM